MPRISAFYLMWNPEICQDPPTCGQVDLVLSLKKIKVDEYFGVMEEIMRRSHYKLPVLLIQLFGSKSIIMT